MTLHPAKRKRRRAEQRIRWLVANGGANAIHAGFAR